jgi:GMP synthase (glutamine-hydrolysing)
MGGPQSVYELDRFPYLRDELRLIEQALKAGVPILGVCLGSQLLAAALGAPVTPGKRKEIGWHRVTLTTRNPGQPNFVIPAKAGIQDPLWAGLPRAFTAFHWHGDVFALTRGAVSLAASALTQHQAFRYGTNAYGLLFHMEVTSDMVAGMVRAFPDELAAAGVDGASVIADARRRLPRLQAIGGTVFGRWTGLARAP